MTLRRPSVFGGAIAEQCDIGSLNREIRRELHLSRQPPGYFVPIDLVMTRSGAQNPANLGIMT
jgi:hypothetical protein